MHTPIATTNETSLGSLVRGASSRRISASQHLRAVRQLRANAPASISPFQGKACLLCPSRFARWPRHRHFTWTPLQFPLLQHANRATHEHTRPPHRGAATGNKQAVGIAWRRLPAALQTVVGSLIYLGLFVNAAQHHRTSSLLDTTPPLDTSAPHARRVPPTCAPPEHGSHMAPECSGWRIPRIPLTAQR